jgi:ABC-type lipoprotein release transport system permease subunit
VHPEGPSYQVLEVGAQSPSWASAWGWWDGIAQSMVLLVVALVAAPVPARRALRIHPKSALRSE